MEKLLPQRGVESHGRTADTRFQADRSEESARFSNARACEFLSKLIGDHRKEVAIGYWPFPEGSERWSTDKTEAFIRQKKNDLDRMLLEHHDRPPTIRLLFVATQVLGPEAGVAIAHFFADELGTERGARKLNPRRVADDLVEVKRAIHDLGAGLAAVLKVVEKIDADVKL